MENLENEVWKDIPNYEKLYQVSNLGRVRSLDILLYREKTGASNTGGYFKKNGRLVAITDNGNGYKIVSLSRKGRKNFYVHRLVSICFLENSKNDKEVNHIDGNKSNNNINNLEWCNHKENIQHAYDNGLYRSLGDKPNAIKVIDRKTNQIFSCIKECADFYEIKYNLLKEALRRRSEPRNPIYKRVITLNRFIEENPLEAKKLGLSGDRLDK